MRTSIVILTRNQLPITFQCLASIRRHTPEPHEIIVVDNGSTDATPTFLSRQSDVKLIVNSSNRGFAAGCNQGYEVATGDHVLFLNNDTVVTEFWLRNMLKAMYKYEHVGMVGPLTNYASSEQQIPVPYRELTDLPAFTRSIRSEEGDRARPAHRLIGFCLLAKKSLLDEIGPFDERFGLGNFEDDDLCLRALQAGYTLQIALDSFVHHIGHQTFMTMPGEAFQHLIEENRKRAADKWGADIIALVRKPETKLSFCLSYGEQDDVRKLERSLNSIRYVADELICISLGAESEEIQHIAQKFGAIIVKSERIGEEKARELARERATSPFLIWWDPVLSATPEEERSIRALKRQLDLTVGLPQFTLPNGAMIEKCM